MLVRFKTATDYEPQPTDSPRCYGQLLFRQSVRTKETANADGTITLSKECGPMVRYFPVGATPDLHDDIALRFIEAGVAEFFVGPVVLFVSRAEIVRDVKV